MLMKLTDRYNRQVRKNLHCDRKTKRTLMDSFKNIQERYLEDEPDPTWEQLCKAFGAPEEMATSLMTNVSQEDQKRYLRQRKRCRIGLGIAAGALFATLVALTIFALSTRKVTIVQKGTIIVTDKMLPTESEAGE